MILSRVSDYLRSRQQASLLDMAIGLATDVQALRGMLSVLERKGRVRKLPSGSSCSGGCTQCKAETIELYAWTGETGAVPRPAS